MVKTVSFSRDEPLCHSIPALSEEEYSLTFYSKDEIEQFRHEAVLEMMGVPSSSTGEETAPEFHLRKSPRKAKRRSRPNGPPQSDAEVLAALAASPLYKQAEQEAKNQKQEDSSSRPTLGQRQPSIREKRDSVQGGRRRTSGQPVRGSRVIAALASATVAS